MFKMEIVIDTDKIEQDGLYDYKEVSTQLDNLFSRLHILKQSDGVYTGGSFAGYGSAILFLKKQPWFMQYVDKWLWYNSDGSKNEEDYIVEDVAAHYKHSNITVYEHGYFKNQSSYISQSFQFRLSNCRIKAILPQRALYKSLQRN